MKWIYILTSLLGVFMTGCARMSPPVAREQETRLEKHGDVRVDPYFWMKDRKNPEVIKHLEAENAYAEAILQPVKPLEEQLFQEIRSRMKEDDSSYPFLKKGYYYYSRYEQGKEYPIYARRKGSVDAPEEILLDVNVLAQGHEYFSVPFPSVSPDNTKIVYAADSQGRRFYDLIVKDLVSGKVLETIPATAGDVEWTNDSKALFYIKQHPESLRAQWLYRHKLGQKNDILVFEEKEEAFFLDLRRSKLDRYIFLVSQSTHSGETYLLDAAHPEKEMISFLSREPDHEYDVEDADDGFYVRTNWQAKNFRLMKTKKAGKKSEWEEVIPASASLYLQDFTVFQTHIALEERANGLTRLRVLNRKSGEISDVSFPDPTYVVSIGVNPNFDASFVRYNYQSLNRPDTVYDYSFAEEKSHLRKQKETPHLDLSQYVSDRIWVQARDGAKIPVSLVYKKGFQKNGTASLMQYAYGSYGFTMEPWFDLSVFSFLDRGFVYAIAHVRGGSELGREWYEDGKMLHKKNTFTDFIDVTEHFIKEKYCNPHHVYAEGGSAGGLLMGAIVNMRPDLYHGVIAAVPFVDVVTTMLDDSIPLTTFEYDQWGNPQEKKYYEYMKSYSPYDNVVPQKYPNILITSGLHDSQVQYWEPTKWAAKLRKNNTGDSLILLKTEMSAGHGGASGRFESLKETAFQYAFLFMLDGKNK